MARSRASQIVIEATSSWPLYQSMEAGRHPCPTGEWAWARRAGDGRNSQSQTSRAVSSQAELGDLVVDREHVALGGGCEAAFGLRQSCFRGTYLAAASMRRFSSSLFSSAGRLVVTMPSTTILPLGTKRSGSKPPERSSSIRGRSRRPQVAEQRSSHVLVAPSAIQPDLKLPRTNACRCHAARLVPIGR